MATEEAQLWKQKGNDAFKQKRYHSAIQNYTKSLELLADPLVFGNRAQAEINANLHILAQMDCTASIQLDPKLPKSYYRRAQALKSIGLFEEAREDVIKCLELTKDAAANSLLTELKQKKNTAVINVNPVERDHYLASTDNFIDIPISCDGIMMEEENNTSGSQSNVSEMKRKALPSLPRSFVDFATNVNYLADDPILFAEYFLQIDESQYHDLFDDLLDDRSVSYIIKSLAAYLKINSNDRTRENISEKLLKLSEVSRFDVIVMLLGVEEKKAIDEISKIVSPTHSNLLRSIFL